MAGTSPAPPHDTATPQGLSHDLRRAYALMRARHGHQRWWPGDTPLEICLGAILTQNTNWSLAERALANLENATGFELSALLALSPARLAACLKLAGSFNVKARRVRAFLDSLAHNHHGDLQHLFAGNTTTVRERLLSIHGIGPETADCMLLYASDHLSFVIDAYTRRVFLRHGWCGADASYDELQRLCQACLSQKPRLSRLDYWRDYHAQIVLVAKNHCRKSQPRCEDCPLRPLLPPNGPLQTGAVPARPCRRPGNWS